MFGRLRGYLPHDPPRSAKVIVACVCLHNVAVAKGLPVPPAEGEDDEDAWRPHHEQRQQPQQNPPPYMIGRKTPQEPNTFANILGGDHSSSCVTFCNCISTVQATDK